MATGHFRLKVRNLLAKKDVNLHKASQRGEISYATMHRYVKHPEKVQTISVRVLYGFLIDGLGFTPEEVHSMPFGEIFEAVSDEVVEKVAAE